MLYPYLDTSYEDRPGPVNLDEQPTSFSEYLRASRQQTLSLNPVQQTGMVRRLGELDSYDTEYTDEVGGVHQLHKGLSSDDPRARRLSVDEANQAGAPIGLRFSEPPTQAQFDYLADLKRSENSRMRILNQSPGIGTRAAAFISDLAATAIDPVNIASGFVPIVGEARYLRMVSRFGRGPARLLKGAAEGGAGAGLVVPLTLYQARELQQEYGAESALMDVVFGAALGSGIHWAGGRINDAIRRRHYGQIFKYLRENDANMPHPSTFDRRTVRVQEGDNAARHESLTAEERGRVLNAAVKALETDQVPKIDTLFDSDPRLANLSIPDKRFPATVKLQAHMTAADHAIGTRGASIIDMAVSRELTEAKKPATPGGLFSLFSKRYKKLSEYSLKTVPPAEFGQRVGNALEHPDQRVAIEEGSKTILVTEGASLGAVRHEIERALDDVYKVDSTARGGYRYRGSDADRLNAHRAAVGEQFDEFPDRAPQTISPRSAIDEFSRRDQPILGAEGPQVSAHIDEVVNREKDVKLDKVISEEEVPALESIVSNIQGRARDLGIMDKVIPAEEREIMIEDATRAGQGDLVRDLFKAGDKAVEDDVKALTVSDAEILMRAGPEKLAEIIKGEKPTETIIKEAADTGLVTRVNAAKDIKFYLKRSKQELDGEGLERAIRAVQNGEDIDVAVNRETQAAKPEAGEPPVRDEEPAPSDDQEVADAKSFLGEDLFDDIIADATAIIEAEKIDDKRDLVKGEAQIVKEEHAALEKTPKARDLFSSVERDEFDEADRDRALRQGDGAGEGGTGGGAGGGGAGDTASARLQTTFIGRDSEAVGGAQPAIERERAAPGGERPAPETTQSYGGWAIPRRVITPDGSVQVGIEPRIVELADLVHAEGDLQVRDRGRKESKIEALNRARQLDPEQLLPNRVADTGAPIVLQGPVNPETGRYTYTIISGNGRVLSLREVYANETLGFKARAYREMVGPAADGYRSPILVSVIADQLSHEELVDFAQLANRSRIAEMSVTEKAQRDADVAGPDLMGLYQGGEFTKKENQPFFRAFMNKVVTAQERGEMSKNGVLTKPGVDRLNAAVLAAAYDDPGTLSAMLEATDSNTKSIANAFRDVAPSFMKLRSEIAQGLVREDMDITAYMMQAINFVEKARQEGTKIANALAQIDAINPINPVIDRLVRQFYNPQLTRANSALRIAQNLQRFVDYAREKRTGGFLEDTTSTLDVLDTAERQVARESDEAAIADADENAGRSPAGPGQTAPQRAPAQSRPDADLGGARRGAEAPARPATEERARPADLVGKSQKELLAIARDEGVAARAWMSSREIINGIEESRRDTAASKPTPVSSKTEKIFDQFISDVQKAKQPAVAPVAAPDLRSQLEGMKVPEIRARAKAEGLEVKGRSKEQIIDSYMKAAEAKKAEPAPVVPEPKPVPSTLPEFVKASGWATAADRMDALKDDGASLLKRGAFLGKAKVIAERLVKKAGQLQDEILARDLEGAGDTLGDMVDDAARLTELDPRPESNAVTQWVRSAAREVNVADRQAKAIEAAPVERPKVVDTPEGAVRTAFYDFLEGGKPLKGSAQLAKELGIDPNQAYLLLDEAENLGWIKLKSNGVYIRVPRERRPLRPDVKFEDGEAMGDVVQFQPRQTPLMQRLSTLNNHESAINAELSRAADEVDVLRAADAPSEQIDDAMFRNNELLAQLNEIQEEIASVRDQIDNQIDGEAAGEAPRGWSGEDMDEESSYLRIVEFNAIKHIAVDEGVTVQAIHRGYGFANPTDYVAVAESKGFEVPKEYRRIQEERSAAKMERDLQSSLTLQRAITDAARRIKDLPIQIAVVDRLELPNFGRARAAMSPYTLRDGTKMALIRILRSAGDFVNLINHEIVHAYRLFGLYTGKEWRVIKDAAAEAGGISKERLARYEPYYRLRAEMMDLHPSMDKHFIDDKKAEEWLATQFGEWLRKRGGERETAIGRIMGRIKDFTEDLRQSFTNIGRRARGLQEKPSLEQIYRAMERGDFARRYQEWGLGRAGADNPLSVNRQAGDEFAAFLNEDMRAIAHDDSESISKATETALTHLAPCAAYHL